MFGLIVDLNFESFAIAPWAAYASIGSYSGYWEYGYNFSEVPMPGAVNFVDKAEVYAGGIAAKIMPSDSLTLGFDGVYAIMDNGGRKDGVQAPEGEGFYTALTVDYALNWGTPGLFAWYASGDSKRDRDKGKFGRLVTLGPDDGVALTRMGFTGSYGYGLDSVVSYTAAGTWGIGLQLADVSFVENLSHTARVAYYQGTNAKMRDGERSRGVGVFGDNLYLTKEDYAFEVNLDSEYQMYENLTVVLELGWIYLDLDKKGYEYRGSNNKDESAYNANLIFRHAF